MVESWLNNWPHAFSARLSQTEVGPSSGYQVSVELSREEGDHLLGSLMREDVEDLAEEEAAQGVVVEDVWDGLSDETLAAWVQREMDAGRM